MVYSKPEQFPTQKYKRLQHWNIDPHKIVKKISSNSYVVDLPNNIGMSNIFNVEYFCKYHSQNATSTEGPFTYFKSTSFILVHVEIEDIVDASDVTEDGYKKYLVK